jgi:hypothetical protein
MEGRAIRARTVSWMRTERVPKRQSVKRRWSLQCPEEDGTTPCGQHAARAVEALAPTLALELVLARVNAVTSAPCQGTPPVVGTAPGGTGIEVMGTGGGISPEGGVSS